MRNWGKIERNGYEHAILSNVGCNQEETLRIGLRNEPFIWTSVLLFKKNTEELRSEGLGVHCLVLSPFIQILINFKNNF